MPPLYSLPVLESLDCYPFLVRPLYCHHFPCSPNFSRQEKQKSLRQVIKAIKTLHCQHCCQQVICHQCCPCQYNLHLPEK